MRGVSRITKSEVYGTFVALCEAANKVNLDKIPLEERPYCGAWKLEYKPGEGYIIYMQAEDGEYIPTLGTTFRKSKEMMQTMAFAIFVIKSIRVDDMINLQQKKIRDIIQKHGDPGKSRFTS